MTSWPPKANQKNQFSGQYEIALKRQLIEWGEWVNHKIINNDGIVTSQQWVWLQPTSGHVDVSLGGVGPDISDRDMMLRGWFPDFSPTPKQWRQNSRNHIENGRGSKVVFRGFHYQVVDIKRNLWGEVRLDLMKDDCDGQHGGQDPQFFIDLEVFIAGECDPLCHWSAPESECFFDFYCEL